MNKGIHEMRSCEVEEVLLWSSSIPSSVLIFLLYVIYTAQVASPTWQVDAGAHTPPMGELV
jgi:hypothetical protein